VSNHVENDLKKRGSDILATKEDIMCSAKVATIELLMERRELYFKKM